MVCKSIKPNINNVCLGDLNERISVQVKRIVSNNAPNTSSTTSFTEVAGAWALIKTTPSYQWIDGVQVNVGINTDFYIRYNSSIDYTQQLWIEHRNIKYRVINIENIDEQYKFIRFRASKTGSESINANLT